MKKGKTNSLSDAVGHFEKDTLRGSLAKTEFVQFRATLEEKQSLKDTADGLNLSVSEYLLKVHSLVMAKLSRE